ncbi:MULTISPECIES: family 16 glycoside hydrolase [Sphingobacterium]|uniref:family 16 glycoside hydrolase n=1 Tax=Sphingobacterium TaxID=28453 RepID=UPI00257ECA4A|nr:MULTISPECIES: family 16 glycoside hydrolase [Sphingobacterium]
MKKVKLYKMRYARFYSIVLLIGLIVNTVSAQTIKLEEKRLTPVQTSMSMTRINGKRAVSVIKSPKVLADDEATYVRINDLDFKDGVIEVKVLSQLLPDAPAHARGFIGLAFRINEDNSRFESIYVRPTNSIANDQLRRNRTVQYFSYPNFKFTDSRATAPGQYESYAPIVPNQWIKLKIEVKGQTAKLFINDAKEPNLIVNDLKMGADKTGAIGLFVDIGTEGFFRDLKVTSK